MSSLFELISQKFSDKAIKEQQSNKTDSSLLVDKSYLIDLLKFVRESQQAATIYLSDINAVDFPEREKRFDVNYLFYSMTNKEWLHIKVQLADGEEIPSITELWEGAFYPEAEVYDLFGISFAGNPFQKRLFLPEEFEGYPLRKDYVNPWEDITFK